jgi:hypothetical protein
LVYIPSLDEEGWLVLTLERIIYMRDRTPRSIIIGEYLIMWRGFPVEDATWERKKILQHRDLELLGDKQSREWRTVISPSS